MGELAFVERMPPLPGESLDETQRRVAQALAAGPRGGVTGPFVPLLRAPALVERVGRLGEYLRFESALPARVSELLMLLVSRHWTQHFEWAVHVPLALKAGVGQAVIDAVAEGRRPREMSDDEALACDLCDELHRTRGLSDTTYRRAVERFGENGLIEAVTVIGYFTMVSMILNVAHTPPSTSGGVAMLSPYPP